MQKNVVTLADEEYDAITGPLVDEACSIIRRIAAARAYLLPVIIESLGPYTADQQAAESGQSDSPVETGRFHRPHFRIHKTGRQ